MLQNKLIKDNRMTFLTLAVSGIISLAVFVYVIFQIVEWNSFRDKTENARQEIEKLNNKKPSPSKENEKRILEDTVVYTKALDKMVLPQPLQPAVDEFLRVLAPPLKSALTRKEIEKYKKPGTGIPADRKKGTPEIPAEMRKFTQDEFCEFFQSRFDAYCSTENIRSAERKTLPALAGFVEKQRSKDGGYFPAGNWEKAVNAFVKEAKKYTLEPVDDATKVAVLLTAMGFDRIIQKDMASLQKYIDGMQSDIKKYATGKKLALTSTAELFIGGGSSDEAGNRRSDSSGYQPENYPDLLYHWDVFGDIVKRVADSDVSQLRQVVLRTRKRSDEREASALDLKSSFEKQGDYKVSHYTVAVVGKMPAIRQVVRNFDAASAENRMYVVRSICLYAKEDGAARLMGQNDDTRQFSGEEEDESRSRSSRSLGRSRRSGRVRDIENEKKEDELQAQIANEEKLPPHKRSDYGMIQIGGDEESIAYIDIDYIVLDKKR